VRPPRHFVGLRDTLLSILGLDEVTKFVVYIYATRATSRGEDMNTSIPRFDRLYRGCACQVLVPSGAQAPRLLEGAAAPSSLVVAYFAVLYIFTANKGGACAVVVPLSRSTSNTYAVHTPIEPAHLHVLRLNESVRRVATIHKCGTQAGNAGDQCSWSNAEKRYIHSQTIQEGGEYTLVDRKGGYPPRSG